MHSTADISSDFNKLNYAEILDSSNKSYRIPQTTCISDISNSSSLLFDSSSSSNNITDVSFHQPDKKDSDCESAIDSVKSCQVPQTACKSDSSFLLSKTEESQIKKQTVCFA